MSLGCRVEPGGPHLAGWRHPRADTRAGLDFAQLVETARWCEQAGLDALFVPDSLAAWAGDPDVASRTVRGARFEPTTLLAALSSVTERIGLVATASAAYNHPYLVARKYASLDHISHGRVGWNVESGQVPAEARSFGEGPFPFRGGRYDRAAEFVGVVRSLWDSYSDEAMVRDRESGRYYDPGELHLTEHRGENFAVRGPLNISRPPQGHPVVFHAEDAPGARDFAARQADVVVVDRRDPAEARAAYRDLKDRAAAVGRDPGHVVVWRRLGLLPAATQEAADAQRDELDGLLHDDVLWQVLRDTLPAADLVGRSLDDPLPQGRTLRESAREAAGGGVVPGSPERIADVLQEAFEQEGADGFLLCFPPLPGALRVFVDEVVPELRRRGLYRTDRTGRTLRENLGLPRPKEVWR